MRCILPRLAGLTIFCLVVAVAADLRSQTSVGQPSATVPQTARTAPVSAAASAAPVTPTGDALFASMLAALESRQSIAARVRHRVDLFGRQLVGSGTYLQQAISTGQGRGPERLLRFELKIQVDDQVTSLLQLCDGNYLWVHQDLIDNKSLSRVDLLRVRRAVGRPETPPTIANMAWMGLGGLPRLMQNLGQWFQFTSVEAGRLDQFPVWILRGQLHTFRLTGLLPEQQEKILAGGAPDFDKMAKQIPERVVLMIGRDDLFPYRLEYWRMFPGEKKLLNRQKMPPVDTMLLAMELFEVQVDVPLDRRQFVYNPGDVTPTDATPNFLLQLGLKEEVEAKVRPAAPPPARR